jgi:hypothetical protein
LTPDPRKVVNCISSLEPLRRRWIDIPTMVFTYEITIDQGKIYIYSIYKNEEKMEKPSGYKPLNH